MIYRSGELTDLDQHYRFAVDVPVPPDGLSGAGVRAIMGAMTRCQGRAEQWPHSEFRAFGTRKRFFVRVGTATECDAAMIADTLAELGAQRAR